MKLCSYVCNRCRLVCVKFYLNRSRFAVVLQNVKGLTFLGRTVVLTMSLIPYGLNADGGR